VFLMRGSLWAGALVLGSFALMWVSGFRGVVALGMLGCALFGVGCLRRRVRMGRAVFLQISAMLLLLVVAVVWTEMTERTLEPIRTSTVYLRFARFFDDESGVESFSDERSVAQRIEEVTDVINAFNDLPFYYLLGPGYGWEFRVEAGETLRGDEDGYQHNVHFTPVMLLARNGILGPIWYVAVILHLGWRYWRRQGAFDPVLLLLNVIVLSQFLGAMLANALSRPYIGITLSLYLAARHLGPDPKPGPVPQPRVPLAGDGRGPAC